MSRFLKPADYSDDEDESRLVRAKPIDSRFARKLGNYGVGKDFVVGSAKSQQELRGSNMVEEKGHDAGGEAMDEKAKLERRNKLGAKILKAKLQNKMDLVEKLEKELRSLDECEQGPSTTSKILYRTDRGDVMIPAGVRGRDEEKGTKSRGRVDAAYRANKSVRDMVAHEKATTSDDHIFSIAKAAAKHRTDDDWVVDDAMMAMKRSRKAEEKEERRSRSDLIKENKVREQTLDSCRFCVEASRFRKHCLVAIGNSAYISSVPWRPLVKEHCLIVPIAHYSSTVTLDEDVYEEIRKFKKTLVSMWREEGMDCMFVETAKNVKHRKHMYIECIAVPNEIGEMAAIYFKKAIDDSEGEWVSNKKLVDLSKRGGGDLRKVIPKGFSYFAVDFGLQPGYAHVIENEDRFPQNFAHEIIGGMMDLDRRHWRMNESLTLEQQRENTAQLKRLWEPFDDWTNKPGTD